MKPRFAFLLAMLLTMTTFATDAEPFVPAVPLERALDLAKAYVLETNVDTSNHYLKSVELKFENDGKSQHWEAQWMSTSRETKGDWFIIRVEMDKTISLVHGK